MKNRWITFVLAAAATTSVVLVAAPAAACCFFKYRGISCGPDSHAQISISSRGPGAINGEYAYMRNGGIRFAGFRVGTGNQTVNVPSRLLDSYNIVPTGGATIVAHGPGCS
jgi:hypothetical protein